MSRKRELQKQLGSGYIYERYLDEREPPATEKAASGGLFRNGHCGSDCGLPSSERRALSLR